jgi:Predicted P-loop-containing kinase
LNQIALEIAAFPLKQFMYRDFQGRNILINENNICLIDYQGAMYGPLPYDIASLLWQAKAQLPKAWKNDLYSYYKNQIRKYITLDELALDNVYEKIVLLRLLQVLGAYGLKGIIQQKKHFLSSIHQGIQNIKQWLETYSIKSYPTLYQLLLDVIKLETHYVQTSTSFTNKKLKVRVFSFSYKQGIPEDVSGNGGGFVFDCRGILNPGRFDEYKQLTGRDEAVKHFLETQTQIHPFLQAAKQAVDISVQDYLQRDFEHLMISFGCTGGQHRSVYCADAMAEYLTKQYGIPVTVTHVEQERKNWINKT